MTRTERWFLDMASALIEGGRLGPAKAMMNRLRQAVEDFGWDRMKAAAGVLGLDDAVATMERVERLAVDFPALPRLLQEEEGRTALSEWVNQHQDSVEQIRGLFLSLLRLPPAKLILRIQTSEGANPIWDKMWAETLSSATNMGGQR